VLKVIATDHPTMLKEALIIAELADNVVVKLPLTPAGLQTCKELSQRQIQTNVTLCFSASQAILAAKAGATYVSPFVGRLDDVGQDGLVLIGEIRAIYDQYPDFNTNILAASIRHPIHVVESAKMGADVATMPPSVLQQMFKHPLTDRGLEQFAADWAKTGQTILAAA
jgi:transaldolase